MAAIVAPPQTAPAEFDHFAILSAVWILASNDENNIITYASARHRLGLPSSFPLEELIAGRGDLFRRGVRPDRLDAWKQQMRLGKHVPSWVRDLSDEKRTAWIDSLSGTDCFRSQFRAGGSVPRSPVEIIDWGLKHLDRLREVRHLASEERTKRWTTWRLPLLSTLVALTAVVGGLIQNTLVLRAQSNLKRYELSFAPKQQAYAHLMRDHLLLYQAATSANDSVRHVVGNDMDATFYELEPFLSDSLAAAVRNTYREFLYLSFVHPDNRAYMQDTFPARADSSRSRLQRLLYPALFRDGTTDRH